ncbi:hypothetical protein [uncultured Duncaniella sp.]|nr:hypothetical protein [uncultured Duncaniella sp.]
MLSFLLPTQSFHDSVDTSSLVTVDSLYRPYHGQASFLRTFADATP